MDDATTAPTTGLTGDDLRLLRVARRIRATDVARAFGCSKQRIGTIEAASAPTATTTRRYLAALEAAERDR